MSENRIDRAPRRAGRRRRRNAARRWCIPPAVLRDPHETLEGMQILSEHETGLGVILWSIYRDICLWSAVEEEKRGKLFNDKAFQRRVDEIGESSAEPGVLIALTALTQVAANDTSVDPATITSACRLVSNWAEGRAAMATAVAFAQAGALASPENGAAAVNAGRLLNAWERPARAETWLRRSVGLSRRGRDKPSYTQALVLLGDLYHGRGGWDQARRYYTAGSRAGRRSGLLALRGEANHGLLLCYLDEATELRDEARGEALELAERHAKIALRGYGRVHPRLGELLHEVARLWIAKGQYGRAIPALQRILPTRSGPSDRAWTLALIAQAAAGTGETALYQEAWSNSYSLLHRMSSFDAPAETALVTLAKAAVTKRDFPRVDQAHSLYKPQHGKINHKLREELAAIAAEARK